MIFFKNVLPDPIAELDYSESDVWEVPEVRIDRGETVLVRSTSGKGKTTFLSIIYGIRNDYSGTAMIDSKDIRSLNASERSLLKQTKVSFLFQGLRLFADLTGYENIEINNRQTSYKSRKQILKMAEELQIDFLLSKPVRNISFGQRQRIALIRALCQPFDLLLLDEPFSHLDKDNQTIGRALIEQECREREAGLILASLDSGYGFNYDKTLEI